MRRQALCLPGLLVITACVVRAPRAGSDPPRATQAGTADEAGARLDFAERIERAEEALAGLTTYTASLSKQERVDGVLLTPQRLECRVRADPFAVYARFTEPAALAGQEVLYVEGSHDGKVIARPPGIAGLLRPVVLDPLGELAMRDNRHPITELGLHRLLEEVQSRAESAESILFLGPEDVDGRPCTTLVLVRDEEVVQVSFDDAWHYPVRFELFAGEHLVERYVYESLRPDAGLGEEDFDRGNDAYALE